MPVTRPAAPNARWRPATNARLKERSPNPRVPPYYPSKEAELKGDAKVLDYLNRGLRSELTAISQYWLHYRMLSHWGYLELAKTWRKESIEEMNHADRFIARILFLDGHPNLQELDHLRIGQNVQEVIEADLAAEHDARKLYQEASTYADGVGDKVSKRLFEELMADEEGHIDFLETQLDLIGQIGLQLYAQKHVGEPKHED
jgi:bacterioferritin